MDSSRTIHKAGTRRKVVRDIRLEQAWVALLGGKGSKEDADLAMADLADYTGYYAVAPEGTSTEMMHRFEGRRDVMARILFLLDNPTSYSADLRRAALDELQISQNQSEY